MAAQKKLAMGIDARLSRVFARFFGYESKPFSFTEAPYEERTTKRLQNRGTRGTTRRRKKGETTGPFFFFLSFPAETPRTFGFLSPGSARLLFNSSHFPAIRKIKKASSEERGKWSFKWEISIEWSVRLTTKCICAVNFFRFSHFAWLFWIYSCYSPDSRVWTDASLPSGGRRMGGSHVPSVYCECCHVCNKDSWETFSRKVWHLGE